MVKKRLELTAACKFLVALDELEYSKTISQLSSEHEMYPSLLRVWKRHLLQAGPRSSANMRNSVRVPSITRRLTGTSCFDKSRPHPSGCT